ncbi:MAG: hypothetical protein AB7U05_07575 [Mangrovibacterium sp.]
MGKIWMGKEFGLLKALIFQRTLQSQYQLVYMEVETIWMGETILLLNIGLMEVAGAVFFLLAMISQVPLLPKQDHPEATWKFEFGCQITVTMSIIMQTILLFRGSLLLFATDPLLLFSRNLG